ncbi:hypothetical protein KKB18_05460, partial [bacterium]|nr:hypothetical protein [bacterium]
MKKFLSLCLFFLSFVIFNPLSLNGEWTESNNFGPGNISINASNPLGYYHEIPDSKYVLFQRNSTLMILDVQTCRIKGGKKFSINIGSIQIIPDKISGWNLFYINESNHQFGKIHINTDGSFGYNNFFDQYSDSTTYSVGVPEKFQIWYFNLKILCLDTTKEAWTEFDYPEGWDIDCGTVKPYPVLSDNMIFGIAKGNTIQDYQAFLLNIETGAAKLINAEENFFKGIKDIASWNENPNNYIIIKSNEIYS